MKVKVQAPLTIIEGVGAAFLEKDPKAFGIFLTCDLETEITRRIKRSRDGESNSSQEEIEKHCKERYEQFEAVVLPERKKFDLELQSLEDHSLKVKRDNLNVL